MKKTICLLLTALLLCALLGSCGKKTISEVDLTLTVGGTAVRPDTSVSALLDAFGTDYTYSDRILYTYPDGDADRLLELYCTADVQTAQGVGIGASRKDVEAAYGTEYTQAGSTMTYALAAQDSLTIPASLYFELDGDTVCAIGLTSAHRAE